MPKIKTHKATSKRIRVTKPRKKGKKSVKLIQRTSGQDHFNSREPGTATMKKRRDKVIHKTNVKSIEKLMPYR
jgi:ribosomal protein L35